MDRNTLREKLSFAKAKIFLKQITGIKIIAVETTKPEGIKWYKDELNALNNQVKAKKIFPDTVDTLSLVDYLKDTVPSGDRFVVPLPFLTTIYVTFEILDFYEFITSFQKVNGAKDMTLFYGENGNLLDLFLNEHDIEIRILFSSESSKTSI